jgi:hypothetical protein
MQTSTNADFEQNYQSHLKHLKLKGLRPKTIEAYSRAIRRVGDRFDKQIDNLSEAQLTDYFTELVASQSHRLWASGDGYIALPARAPLPKCLRHNCCIIFLVKSKEVTT